MKRVTYGLALGTDRVVCVPLEIDGKAVADAEVRCHTRPPDGPWTVSTLETALRAVTAGDTKRHLRFHIALLPPFVSLRFVDLPPLRPTDRLQVLRRDVGRHFIGRESRVIAADRPGSRTRVVVAPAELLETLDGACQRLGARVLAVRSAFDVWAAASGRSDVLVVHDGTCFRLSAGESGVHRVRRAPGFARPWLQHLFAEEEHGPVSVIAPPGDRAAIAEALASRGHEVHTLDADPDEIAARSAARSTGPVLIADAVHARNAARTLRQTRILAVAAVLLAASAAIVDGWSLSHRLEVLRERRAAIRDDVAPVLAVRDSLDAVRERLQVLRNIASEAPRFTDLVFDLALLLPDDAYVTQLAGDADSVLVRGTAENAARAAAALRNSGAMENPHFVGAIRRELRADAPPLEHFTLVGQLRSVEGDASASASAGGNRRRIESREESR